ncbi:family 16 glycosylhydrolase [Cryomorphaceae bacterium 1068]|nr:family 16 glycosylhydrolase [Cryomorphaceae bacterium 1068]
MKVRPHIIRICTLFLAGAILMACEADAPAKEEKKEAEALTEILNDFSLQLGDFTSSEGEIAAVDSVLSCADNCWLEYSVNVPLSGRYRVSLSVKGMSDSSMVWIEDHVHNTDDRTYNITSNMAIAKSDKVQIISRDGSPLREGKHDIRLHLVNGVEIHSVDFELLRKHEETPLTLTQNMEGDSWEIVWADEFDGDGIADTTKWTYDIGNWGWGNGELQYYTVNRPENARQENGNLIIEAHKNDLGYPWTSARLTTRGKTSFLYGKLEFRAKVPAEKGNWSAGWTLGDKYVDELSWPYCGEIDILESVGYQMDNETGNGTAHASAHCGAYYFKLGNQPTGTTSVENMNSEFHTYGVVWTPDGITAYVDDVEYFTYDDTSSELSWPFGQAQNLILNLTMGGGWGGLEGMDESVTKQQMVIDYVRVYQKTN